MVLEKVNEELDARSEMLIEHLVVEASIANGKTSELSCVPVRILAASNGCFDESVLQQLLVEVARVAAKITNQVAHFSPDSCIFVANERVQVSVNVCVVDRLVELF